ncbi:membrane protein insertase YidC [Pandoraea pnomenusa]|jgi:YidC/Oxa1 family membrane protein insertase|uniref:membrane protein insertase YidC n=2 Tax=Pandoraea pnomenusa TaxID=93220 RepID=UPI0004375722|nr:membrane protein insertase YidC [Pandoraea pnomenusa]AHN75833.1 membrane protein insertase YidC [Pandoraea pnomenusa]ANC44712.1 membrane protein insertase YidC [Pandoraea pnomenusa]QDH61972.1 membrane protein insertase YidC [Pandoraea pnomenusa]QDX24003.1 membrane protein insertase YidC [Pandoraea pnomenusa]
MDIKRTVLWVIFALSVVMLFDNWQRANGHSSLFFPTPEVSTPAATGTNKTPANDLPQGANAGATAGSAPGNAPAAATAQKVRITTDVYEADISTQGGTLSFLALTKWPDAEEADKHVVLFDNTPSQQYFARTGLIGGDFPNHNDIFTQVPGPTTMTGDTLTVKFESPVKGGLQLVRAYTFHRGSYVIDVSNTIVNKTDAAIKPTLYMELVRDGREISGAKFSHTFTGPAVYSSDEKFQKITFSDIDKDKAKYIKQSSDGWIGMVQHYFATAWIPKEGAERDNYIGKLDNGLYRVGVKQPLASIPAGGTETVDARLFAGPQEEHMLEQIAPGLELTKDYGYFTILAKPLFWLLSKLHGLLGNWGWAIIAVTVIIKLIFFPLSAASYKSMARMKEITPRMQALRERYKSDPQKMNAALMELYKTEKVNPFGGCIPIVIQIPVFIALYWVLLSSVEMRGAPWLGWIHDLSTQDPYYILPVLMAVSMFIQTKLNPTPPDPMQAKMMMFMPLIFSVMFLFLPSGLVLYYVVNNSLSIAQQWSINRMLGTKKEKKATS